MVTRFGKIFVILFVMLPLVLAAGCATRSKPLVSDELLANTDEKMLWRVSLEEQRVLDSSGLVYQDPQLEDYLNKMVAMLQPRPGPAALQIRVKVIKNPYLNAFAYPDGAIYIHTGLLARMDNEDQLAALLAHEMTHSTHRHALRAFRRFKDGQSFPTAVQKTLMATKGLQALAKTLGLTGSLAAVSGYTRELEKEADRVGIDLMIKAGYDWKKALVLFDHLITEMEQEGFQEPIYFGKHPRVRERVESLQNMSVGSHPRKEPVIKNSAIFLARLERLIFNNAKLDLRIGRFQAAGRGIEKYLRIRPDDTRAYFMLGEIFRQQGAAQDTSAALKYYNKAIALDPTYAEPHKAIGLIHYKQGRRALAQKFFESSLQLSPDTSDKAYILGYIKQCTQAGEG